MNNLESDNRRTFQECQNLRRKAAQTIGTNTDHISYSRLKHKNSLGYRIWNIFCFDVNNFWETIRQGFTRV